MSLKILLITSDTEDYLQDSIIHGFKTLFKNSAVDFPQKVSLYKGFDTDLVRGNGFTLYGLLINDNTSIYHGALRKIKEKFYDVIIFTSIHRQSGLYFQLYPFLDSTKVVFLDGEDHPYLYPYIGQHMRKLSTFFCLELFQKVFILNANGLKKPIKDFIIKMYLLSCRNACWVRI